MAKGKTVTMAPKKKGQSPVSFQKGGLHTSTNTPAGEPISASTMAAAKAGEFGDKAVKQANMATGMLAAGRATAAKHKAKKKGA